MNTRVTLMFFILIFWTGLASHILAQNANYSILSFKKAGKFICLESQVDSQKGNFILDTGFRGILLNRRYFKGIKSNRVLYGINGKAQSIEIKKVNLSLGAIQVQIAEAEIANLSHIEDLLGTQILGLIGGDFFMDKELVFDFSKKELAIFSLDRKGQKEDIPEFYSTPIDTLPLKFKGHLPTIKVQVGEKMLRFAIDSGAESNILCSRSLKKVSFYLQNREKTRIYGLGKKWEFAIKGKLIGMKIGDKNYLPMKTVVKNLSQMNREFIGPGINGIIGYEFLSQQKVAINFKKKELYIWEENLKPNTGDALVKRF